ncbi:MAG: hypothetical protein K9N46_06570 [Candidatus Marinimicrobia bacterium]|nr:hypothetical protein [Candidatus Neomarinimicrobiota bacterium]MCF7828643.1 hypothetical protein [Candidatus Neomarinimicrobiota bacterium]MCF7880384.1 hypothetical protein [Candidatus Neomarinimicrobiota bacterium]
MKNMVTTLLLLLGIAAVLGAQESDSSRIITGEITYISADRIYGKPGTDAGLELGDSLHVLRDDSTIGTIVITAISSGSHSAQIAEQSIAFAVGDGLQIRKPAGVQSVARSSPAERDTVASPESDLESVAPETAATVRKADSPPFLRSSGSVTLRYYGIYSNRSLSTFHQPAALIRWRGEEIGGSPLRFEFYGRAQKDLARDLSSRDGNRPLLRVYSAGFVYDSPGSEVVWQAGRVYPRKVSGIGTIDGVLYGREQGQFSYGITAGFQPDYYSNGLNTEILKAGAYTGWSNEKYGDCAYSAILAFVGQYRNGNVDREYFTVRQSYTPVRALRLSYVGDFSLDRNDYSSQIGLVTPSSSYLRINWSRISWMRVSVRYSFRKSIRLFATQSLLPDSLYNYQSRQGLNGSLSFTLPWDIRLQVSQNYRTHQAARNPVLQTSGMVYARDVFGSGIRVRARYAHGSNDFSVTDNFAVSAERTVWKDIATEVGYDLYQYGLRGRGEARIRHNANIEVSTQFLWDTYLLLRYDSFRDSDFVTDQISASLSMNF